ncbi:hypothetical protein PSAC2689_160012 [Paraburkholderia sacchari]
MASVLSARLRWRSLVARWLLMLPGIAETLARPVAASRRRVRGVGVSVPWLVGRVEDKSGTTRGDETTRKDSETPRPDQPTGYCNSLESRHARMRSEVKNGAEEGLARNCNATSANLGRG